MSDRDPAPTDLHLLDRYARHGDEAAFAEVVRRHLGLVHSAALRQVRSPQLAEEAASTAFQELARAASRLAPDTVVPAWLYAVTRRIALNTLRGEARRRLREQVAHELSAMNATAADWTAIAPLLDDAMHALDETDRAAVLLRYFENKPLREVGAALGLGEDAAQKRVSRAVERLREWFVQRGIKVGAGGLGATLSAHAIQTVPVGLAAAIVTMAGTATLATTSTLTPITSITMTTFNKIALGAVILAIVGGGVYLSQKPIAHSLETAAPSYRPDARPDLPTQPPPSSTSPKASSDIADEDAKAQMRHDARFKSITFATNENFDEKIRRSISEDEEKMKQLVGLVALRDIAIADRLDPYVMENGFTLEITLPGQSGPTTKTVLYGDDAALLALKTQYGAEVDAQIKSLLTEDEFQRFIAAEKMIRLRLYGVLRVDLVLLDQQAARLDEQSASLLLDSLVRNNPSYNSSSINYFNEKVLAESRSFLGETQYAALVQANARAVILDAAIEKAKQTYEANGKKHGTVVINNQNGAAKFVPATGSNF